MPDLIIIAGANGAGKTTFARPYVKEFGYDFLNADDIAKTLADRGEKSPMIAAGRMFFEQLNKFLDNRQSIVVETTLSGSYINKVAQRAKALGYYLKVIYLFVDSPEVCILRVKGRLLKGGHDVPEEDIERRFYRSLRNFWENFRPISDEWNLIYNGEIGWQLTATGNKTEFEILNEILMQFFNLILEK
ncbi:MAG: AAA family ATPase [Lewinellaceae bacterium]|nr:AAA family ATPase [Saprospiraceae bacterium]MCB9341066.1 AAA family ATPase [Lewinellaceae bacterium]